MSNQIVISSGAKVRSLEGVLTGTAGIVSSVPLGAANGVATLDSSGKVPLSQLPASVVTYLGTWNAATNTPTLANGTGDVGDLYICNVAGTVNFGAGPITFAVGDWVIYNGSQWQKSAGQNGTVTSVAVTSTGNDAISITGSPITTAGTINIGFTGTSAQYVNGAGDLTTFPSLTGYVPYTGATTDVDLGVHVLNAQALHVKGTAGAGHLGLKHQSAAATGSANESLIYANVDGDLAWQNDNLYLTTLSTHANTANRVYTFPDANGTLALVSDLSGYVPTSRTISTNAPLQGGGNLTANRTLSITQATTSTDGYLSSTDWNTFNSKQSALGGTGIVKSTAGTISYLTDNSANWNTAYNDSIVSAAVTGVATKTLTLTQQDGGTITASWTDYDTAPVTSVFGRTGAVTAQSGDYTTTQVTEGTNLYYTDARARGAISLTTTGSSGAATYNSTTGVFNIPNYGSALSGYVPYTGATSDVDLGIYKISSRSLITTGTTNGGILLKQNSVISGEVDSQPYTSIKAFDTRYLYFDFGTATSYKRFRFDANGLTDGTTITYTMPNASGTLALTSDIPSLANYVTLTGTQTITGVKTFSNEQLFGNGLTINNGFLTFADSGFSSTLDTTTLTASRAILLPNASGTLALTSQLTSGTVTSVGLSSATSGVTIGSSPITTSGTITLAIATASGSQQGLLSSTDWTTFNNKQNALTNPITGTGTTNFHAKFTGSTTLGNSIISDNGSIATVSGDVRLDNGAADGAQLVLASSGFSDWNIDNYSGRLRAYYGSTEYFTIANNGSVGIGTNSPTNFGASYTVLDVYNASVGGYMLVRNPTVTGQISVDTTAMYVQTRTNHPILFTPNNTERMRITSGGALCIGTTSAGSQTRLRVIDNTGGQGTQVAEFSNAAYLTTYFYTVNSDNWNAAGTAVAMGRNSSTGRSINAGGTINASGADYAEYMTKAIEDSIAKGDIVGVNENGLLTNIFVDAKSFVVKSTNPSYVGGDTWGSVDDIGKLPEDATEQDKLDYEAKLEAARAKVDRIAFSGQVPCNVLGANVGDYIIPINDNGKITGQAVTNPTFEQYQISVGKVWKIMEDGRAWIAVKIG